MLRVSIRLCYWYINILTLFMVLFYFCLSRLLLVSRVLKKLDMDAEYKGNVEATAPSVPFLMLKADDGKNAGLDAQINRKYIFGGHVGINMRSPMENEHEKFQTHFAMHAAVRGDPTSMKTEKEAPNVMPTRS
ncbi:hypothetical protein MKW94_028917, partial [Papaver nudicaule]|nr:hypothetical protein [Papaver nudicaule]